MDIQIDILHAALAGLCVAFLIAAIRKRPAPPPAASTPEPAAEKKLDDDRPQLIAADHASALQVLALLQQEARFIDFVQEDLSGHSDQDIGAVARVLHEGSRKVLQQYFTLEPVRKEEEASNITLEQGFNASEIRLTGNVSGEPPFSGTLIHRGWKASDIRLPKLSQSHDTRVIAQAEVEL